MISRPSLGCSHWLEFVYTECYHGVIFVHAPAIAQTLNDATSLLSIEWNSIRLGGPAHAIVTKTAHKTLLGWCRLRGSGWGLGVVGIKGMRGWSLGVVGVKGVGVWGGGSQGSGGLGVVGSRGGGPGVLGSRGWRALGVGVNWWRGNFKKT